MRDDMTLKQDIIDELDCEPSVEAAGIGVTVRDGVVTLGGHVPRFYQRAKAEEAVWRVDGVRGLVEELEVEQGGDAPHDDETLAVRALERLDGTVAVPTGRVQVKVQKGWIMLHGELERESQRQAAVEALESLEGVGGIVNQIRLVPSDVSEDIRERIEKALHRHADIEASRVEVTVEDGVVRLRGGVASVLARGEIRRAAWSAPGVVDVVDEMAP